MHSLLLRPGSDNSTCIYLWCKLRHAHDISNYRSWFPFLDNCIVWLMILFFYFFQSFAQPFFVNGIIPPLLLPKQDIYCTLVHVRTRLYILLPFIEIIKAWSISVYEHVDTRISSRSYIKLKRLDIDIKTKCISKTCTNYETKGNPRKKCHIAVSNPQP